LNTIQRGEEVLVIGKKKESVTEVDELWEYCRQDSILTDKLAKALEPLLEIERRAKEEPIDVEPIAKGEE
jgi:hypothetical protein